MYVILTVLLSAVFSIFSTAVLSYISMATPIGPWIGPTLAFIALLIFRPFMKRTGAATAMTLSVAAGSIGGILATGFGFSFPTLYFLDPFLFDRWMAQPAYFFCMLSGLAFVSGWLGMWVADRLEYRLIVQEKLSFPIGQMVHKIVAAVNNVRKAYELVIGFLGTAVFCMFQDGIGACKSFIPKAITLLPALRIGIITSPLIRIDIWPMLWAIGFVTGHVITVPLAVGALSKVFLVDPLNIVFFKQLSSTEFVLAFCSGMVLIGAALSFLSVHKSFKGIGSALKKSRSAAAENHIPLQAWIELAILLAANVFFLSYVGFSLLAQCYLLFFTILFTYQITLIAGRIGLAPLGRFATFVMVPAMFFFGLDTVQIVFIATFVEVAGGVAADVLFGRKLAHLSGVPSSQMRWYQYLGLIVSACVVGIIFWILIKKFSLGSVELFAYKAQSRQLLISAKQFDYWVLALGGAFGYLLKLVRVNAALVLGGLLMPINFSLGLVLGGLATLLVKDKEEWFPFWSGVFASNSIWMVIKALC